jgi:hypothetical protein
MKMHSTTVKKMVTCILGGILVSRHFSETCCQTLHNGSSETPVHIYQTTRRHILEDCHIRFHHRENLTSHTCIGNVAIGYTHLPRQTTLTRPCIFGRSHLCPAAVSLAVNNE